jgi:hypothetical protein
MKRVALLAVVASTSGLFASAATGDHGGHPALAPAVTQAHVTSDVAAPPFDIRKIGAPIVKRVGPAWNVTLRFAGTAPGSASLAVTRGSERVQTFRFDAGTGVVTVGPFVLAQSGQYRFTLSVTSLQHVTRVLAWEVCLDCKAPQQTEMPLKKLGEAHVVKRADGWAITVSFETLTDGNATIRLVQSGETLTTFRFEPKRGRIDVGPFVVPNPGRYELILQLTDSTGSTRGLTWSIVAK